MVRELEPDLVVMDMVLSSMDGLEVLRELQRVERRPRVLIVSGFVRSNMAELAAAEGADYYLMKPCKMTTVLERLRQMAALYMLGGEDNDLIERGGQSLESVITAIIH